MRTTVILPPALLRAAKARSAERGESLKALITRAVTAEVAASGEGRGSTRMCLPLFGDPAAAKVRVTNRDIADHLAETDVEVSKRRRRNTSARRSRR